MAKLLFLKSIESEYVKNNDSRLIANNVCHNNNKPKYFCTFPYPYMNGRPHLGHGLTIMGCELQARYKLAKGYNVLFPFGFHGSGMPIVSSAKKLQIEMGRTNYLKILSENDDSQFDNFIKSLDTTNQIRILLDMKVNKHELVNFIDPKYWITYFTQLTKHDVTDMHIYCDFSRSFYTTDMNPYYDSFIKWQFTHLINKGYVYKGKRNVIYSRTDNQACADHDRQTGEGVKPTKIKVKFLNSNLGNLMITLNCTDDVDSVDNIGNIDNVDNVYTLDTGSVDLNSIIITSNNLIKFRLTSIIDFSSCELICDQLCYENISHQFTTKYTFELIGKIELDQIINNFSDGTQIESNNFKHFDGHTGFYFEQNKQSEQQSKKNILVDFEYEIPENKVISRSGDLCIVAEIDQWLIDYGNEKLNVPVKKYIEENLELQDESTRKIFLDGVDWLKEWPCSRNYGLGTTIPNTNDLIDSLSDSTIYMALYTIYHLVTQIPIELITNELWDYIFLNTNSNHRFDVPEYDKVLEEIKKEFTYWYPLNLRVSGKDLIKNHLTMALLNHQAIWENNNYFPIKYFVNGHLLLNGEKMSKSTGNFMTLRDAINKYGSDATRFALTNSFTEGLNDGNFITDLADVAIMKLYNEIEFVNQINKQFEKNSLDNSHNNFTLWDKIFNSEILNILKQAENYYETFSYREIIVCFDALISSKNKYLKIYKNDVTKLNYSLLMKYFEILITVISPVCPVFGCHISDIFNLKENWTINCEPNESDESYQNNKYIWQCDVLSNITSISNKLHSKQNNKTIIVNVIKNFTDTELEIINNLDNIQSYLSNQPKEKFGQYKAFSVYVSKKIEKYGKNWIKWTTQSNTIDEYEMIVENLKYMLDYQFEIKFIESNDKYMFKFGPSSPNVILST